MDIQIGPHTIGENHPTYFIADISANHDGDLERAKLLIHLVKEAGAQAAKFQNFRAPQIVSDYGFKHLGGQLSHQATWNKSVFEVYQDASLPFEWTPILKTECDQAGIDYFSSPYDFDAIDMLDPYVPAYKIGSGDITWPEALERMARKGKPVILATGDGAEWHITIPVNATARIVLQAGAIEDLREGPGPGVPVGRAAGIRDAHMEGGLAVVTAGSGTYRFVSRPKAG